jgi:hypothetical protein
MDGVSRAVLVHSGSVVSCACRVTPGCPRVMVHDCISGMRASAAKYIRGKGVQGVAEKQGAAAGGDYRRGRSVLTMYMHFCDVCVSSLA